jgi:hypothetical protein
MEITGHQLRAALNDLNFIKDAKVRDFESAQWFFESAQERPNLYELGLEVEAIEEKIVRVQMAQVDYNLSPDAEVRIQSGDRIVVMSLARAIKRAGGADRIVRMWANAAQQSNYAMPRRGLFDRGVPTRTADEELAQRSMSAAEAQREALRARQWANSLRAAIAETNAIRLDIPWLQPEDLVAD